MSLGPDMYPLTGSPLDFLLRTAGFPQAGPPPQMMPREQFFMRRPSAPRLPAAPRAMPQRGRRQGKSGWPRRCRGAVMACLALFPFRS